MKYFITRNIFLLLFLSSVVSISTVQASQTPTENTSRVVQEPLLATNRNISGNDFSALYMSKDPLKRQLAEMYINGVLDMTEGRTWCSYNVLSPDAAQEQIYLIFKKASAELLKNRASEIISESFSRILPCRKAK